MAPISDQLTEARDDLAAIKDVWDTAQLCERQFDTWRGTLWSAIKVEDMEDGTKGLVKEVKSLSKKVQGGCVRACVSGGMAAGGGYRPAQERVAWQESGPLHCHAAARRAAPAPAGAEHQQGSFACAAVLAVAPASLQVRDESAYKGLDQSVKNYLVSVPLVADLRSPAMRPRHWEALMQATAVSGTQQASRSRLLAVVGSRVPRVHVRQELPALTPVACC